MSWGWNMEYECRRDGGKIETMEGQSWIQDCQRLIEEFNEIAIPAFRQEWGDYEEIATFEMALRAVQADIQLDVGPRATFLIETETGLVYKIGNDGRTRYDKCVGHITGITGRELYRWLWW